MMQTPREKVAAELAAAKSAAEMKRARGESDVAEHAQIGRLQGELDRLNEANEDPGLQAYLRNMDQRQAQERADRERAATQRRNREEREFAEALDKHYQDRLEFYRQTKPGLPKADFDAELWPRLRQSFMAGEEDAVDQERREQSTPIF